MRVKIPLCLLSSAFACYRLCYLVEIRSPMNYIILPGGDCYNIFKHYLECYCLIFVRGG